MRESIKQRKKFKNGFPNTMIGTCEPSCFLKTTYKFLKLSITHITAEYRINISTANIAKKHKMKNGIKERSDNKDAILQITVSVPKITATNRFSIQNGMNAPKIKILYASQNSTN